MTADWQHRGPHLARLQFLQPARATSPCHTVLAAKGGERSCPKVTSTGCPLAVWSPAGFGGEWSFSRLPTSEPLPPFLPTSQQLLGM